MENDAWNELLKKLNFTDVELRDARYDCVVHLVTAAIGAEAFYGQSTNAVRLESLDEAKILDSFISFLLIFSFFDELKQ